MTASKDVIKARRKREKQYRISTILNSAQKVFFEKGFIKATMDEIAIGAAISKPTIYQYFETKEDLFLSFALPIIEEIDEAMITIEIRLDNDEIITAQQLIEELFNYYFIIYKKSPEMFSVLQVFQETKRLFGLSTQIKENIVEKGKKNYRSLRRLLKKAMKKGILQECDPFVFGDILWAITVGIIQVEDIKGDYDQGHKFKKAAFTMAAEIFAGSLGK